MLQASTLTFLSQLHKNNNKPWFDANRKKYEGAKVDFLQLVEKSIHVIGEFDNTITPLEPKKCIFRINRDVRFSKDKSPYKNNMGASFNKGGKKHKCRLLLTCRVWQKLYCRWYLHAYAPRAK